jgi:hypothetical protein
MRENRATSTLLIRGIEVRFISYDRCTGGIYLIRSKFAIDGRN